MSKQNYDWKRFWCPRGAQISLGDRGYLVDPESEWGKHYNPELVGLEAIADIPCLVLLGEPGIGKSQEMKNLVDYTEATLNLSHAPLELNLRSCGNLATDLVQDQDFIDWTDGSHYLYLFLDSLDEGLLETRNLATQLVDEFSKRKYRDKLHRLYLRIACRTAVFPQVLEEGLKELWKNGLAIYELVPLRYADVKTAATKECIEPQGFFSEVWTKNLVPLAIKPVTLRFLLNIYKRHNSQFSPDQTLCSLYLEGCRLLGEEVNLSRYGTSLVGDLDSDRRLILAARIAAITVFANRFAVWAGINDGEVPAEDVLIQQLIWGSETSNCREVEVTKAAIREVLDTGLFSSRGLNRMGWAHQTYAEFLAAWYLKQHNLGLSQILSLILHLDGRVIPQLQETTAWLASMIPEIFQEVMKTDPDVLLQSDLATIDETGKASLVEALLRLHDQGKLVYQYRLKDFNYLNHSNLPAQLQLYITDSTRSITSRYVAIDITEDCNVQAVQSNLVDVALDASQPYWIRTRAASAVVCVGNEQTKAQLKPLAIGSQDDIEDELKGYALKAVYPTHMTTEEVLGCLTQPKASYIGGCYQNFVAKELGLRLPLTDLLAALEWLLKNPIRDPSYPFRELSDALILRAWNHLENPEVLSKFAQIALLRLSQHGEMIGGSHGTSFKQLLEENDFKRRQLLEAVISIIPNSDKEPLWLAGYTEYSPLTPLKQDLLWLIEKLQASDSDQIQRTYAKLIRWKLDWHSADQLSLLLTVSQNSPILRAEFSLELEPILLNSHKADQARLEYIKLQEMLTPRNQRKLLDPPPKVRVLGRLSQFEAGSVDAWWHLCREMTLTPTSTQYNERFEADITTLPGWQEADEKTKLRIIVAAKQYIYQGKPETEAWLGTNSFRYSALAGYKALHLLSVKDPDFISIIPPNIWEKWAAVILDYPNARESKDKEIRQRLIKEAYNNAPSEFVRALIILIDHENTEHRSVHINCELRNCWDECLAAVLVDKVKDERLSAKSLGDLLKDLLVNQVDEAKVFAESLIPLPLPASGEARAKAIVAAQTLMLYAEDAGWSVVWSAIKQDPEFGREVLKAISYAVQYEGNIEQRLKEDCIADLYIFLIQQYPDVDVKQQENSEDVVQQYPDADVKQQENSEDRELTGVEAYVVEPEGSIGIWRDYIPQRLQARGTSEACDALRKIIRELPEHKEKLQPMLLECEAQVRRITWKPPTPEGLLQLVLTQDPSNSDLSNQLENIDRRTQEMADEPKVDQSIHIGAGSNIPGVVSTGSGNRIEHKIDPSNAEKGFDWKFWLSITVTVTVALISVAASGVFNDEIKKLFFNQNVPPHVDQKLEKQTN